MTGGRSLYVFGMLRVAAQMYFHWPSHGQICGAEIVNDVCDRLFNTQHLFCQTTRNAKLELVQALIIL